MKNPLLLFLLLALNATSFNVQANTPAPLEQVIFPMNAWTGIGRLRSDDKSFCTASLLDTRGHETPTASAPAYVITSQRCLDTTVYGTYTYPGGIQHNTPLTGHVYFNNFDSTPSLIKKYAVKTIAWQSDESMSLAIIELEAPLSALLDDGIQPLKIARDTPPKNTEIRMLGVPDFSSLYSSTCTQQAAVDIAAYPWVSNDMLSNQCASFTQGGHGAPVLNKATHELISLSITNTHGFSPDEKCLEVSPCELMGGKSLWSPDTHYTRPVAFLNQCFARGVLAVSRPECALHKLNSVVIDEAQLPPARIMQKLNADEKSTPDTFKINLTTDTPYFRYKYTHSAAECRNGQQYSQITDATQTSVDFTLDDKIGMHLLCILGVDSHEDRPTTAQYRAAKIIAIERIAASPAQAPHMLLEAYSYNDQYHSVYWYYDSPFLDHYEIKYGPIESTDCANPEGYAEIPGFEERLRNDGPWEKLYEHKDHPTHPELILIKRPRHELNEDNYGEWIKPGDQILKLCTVLFNQENQRSEPRVDILRPI